ncbi:MAG TPA: TolC family protein [Terriglobia bacterium]|nr:TolC family protein [Terriglobia bacterium]
MKYLLGIWLCLSLLRPEAQAQPQTTTRTEQVGLNRSSTSGTLSVSLQEAVTLALENNPVLKVEKVRVQQARSKIGQSEGEFAPLFNSGTKVNRGDIIVASRFYPTGFYNESQKSQSLGIEGKSHVGTKFTVGLSYADQLSTSNTQTLSPQYSALASIGFSQSLLRDFGRGVSETKIRVAEKGAAIAEGNLFTKIAQMIERVEEAYWNFTFLLKEQEGRQRSLDNAREFLTQNENLLRAGRVAQVSVLQARSAVAERERDLVMAQAAADQYEDRLKNLLWLDLNTTHLIPTDPPVQNPVNLDLQKSLDAALQRRPEIRALQSEVEQRDIELKYAGNQKKPRLDLNVQYAHSGLSGKPSTTCIDPTSALCIPVGSNVSGSIFDSRTAGRDALANIFSLNPYENWSVELKLQIPLSNQAAKEQYSEASLKRLESGTNLVSMRDQITIEIRDAIREAQSAQKRVDSSREANTYVEDQVEGMRRQLDAGLVSSYDVLKAFDEVDKARTIELQAMMDFNVALSKLRLAEASGFQKYGIELSNAPQYSFDQVQPVK